MLIHVVMWAVLGIVLLWLLECLDRPIRFFVGFLSRPVSFFESIPFFFSEFCRTWCFRLQSPFFKPDVRVAADPLEPLPRVIAGGIAAAMRRCAAEGRPVRLLVSRVPGATIEIRFRSVVPRCFVDRVDFLETDAPKHAEASLPTFTPGAASSVFRIAAETDDLRLEFLPGARLSYRIR